MRNGWDVAAETRAVHMNGACFLYSLPACALGRQQLDCHCHKQMQPLWHLEHFSWLVQGMAHSVSGQEVCVSIPAANRHGVRVLCVSTCVSAAAPAGLPRPTRLHSASRCWAPQRTRQPVRQPHCPQHTRGLGSTWQWCHRQCTAQHQCTGCGCHRGAVQPSRQRWRHQPNTRAGTQCKHTGGL
jgi:hypothetical protein